MSKESLQERELNFRNKLKLIRPYLSCTDYISNKKMAFFECNKCGYKWNDKPVNVLAHVGCPVCNKNSKNDNYVKLIKERHPNIEILSFYTHSRQTIEYKCINCGTHYKQKANTILSSKSSLCSVCKGVSNKSNETFVNQMKSINNNIELLSDYINLKTKIKCKCKICNNIWLASPSHLLNNHGCPKCATNNTSFIEQYIYECFSKALGRKKVQSRNSNAIGKELDIYIPELKIAFEPGDWKFHKLKANNDKEKQQLCKENNIQLITIYYECRGERNDVDALFFDNNIAFDEKEQLNLIYYLFKLCNINYEFTQNEIVRIREKAFSSSRRLTTNEFKKISSINKNITILGEYKGSSKRIKCQCKKCGNIWQPTANSLVSGRGCKKCASLEMGVKKRTDINYAISKLKLIHPDIKYLSNYKGTNNKCNFICEKCGYEFESTFQHLYRPTLKGNGCPKCSHGIHRTQKEFIHDVEIKNPNVIVLGQFINTRTRILCQCKMCGNKWNPIANEVLRGCKCNKCHFKYNQSLEN